MNIVIGWPEGIYLALNLICVGWLCAMHGKPRTGTYSAWDAALTWFFITLPVLYWGGFFS